MGATEKLQRMADIVRCDLATLTVVAERYSAARKARKSPKRAHTAVSEIAGWDYATWAQNLVDVQGVSL